FGVISFNDRYGGLLELLRRAFHFQACRLESVHDSFGEESLKLAQRLFAEDFARLNSSRKFEAWWRDNLVNPFYASRCLWSFPEILAIVEAAGCEFHSSSPVWARLEHYNWYKNVPDAARRRSLLLADWRTHLAYFLTGF